LALGGKGRTKGLPVKKARKRKGGNAGGTEKKKREMLIREKGEGPWVGRKKKGRVKLAPTGLVGDRGRKGKQSTLKGGNVCPKGKNRTAAKGKKELSGNLFPKR